MGVIELWTTVEIMGMSIKPQHGAAQADLCRVTTSQKLDKKHITTVRTSKSTC